MRLAVLADTHVSDTAKTTLPDAAWSIVRGADVILHAGDVTGRRFLEELGSAAPLYAVRDSGPRAGREARVHRRFPDADIVVFGHSPHRTSN